MTITINGDGTIGGVSVGGLPDGIVDADMLAANAVTTAKISDSQVTNAKLASSGGLAKAWVNCGDDGTVTSSFNVSSVTDNGSADLTINFSSALADANYCMSGGAIYTNGSSAGFGFVTVLPNSSDNGADTKTTSACRVQHGHAQTGTSNAQNVVQASNNQPQIYMVFHGD